MIKQRGIIAASVVALSAVVGAQGPTPKTYHFKASDLKAPTEPHRTPPTLIPQPADATIQVPAGFTVTKINTGGYKRGRIAVAAPNGDIFVSDAGDGAVIALRDANRNGTIEDDERHVFATGLKQPFGLAFQKGALYVAATDQVVRYPYTNGDLKATADAVQVTPLPTGPGHWTRNIAFSPDGRAFYVTVGSADDIQPDPDPLRATVLRFKADGTGREVLSSGLRNPVGLAVNPATREVWTTVQEREALGDDLVPDFMAKAAGGRFYGWPWAYIGPNEDPRHAGKNPELVRKSVVPEVIFESHSSAFGMTFCPSRALPERYRTGAFVALRGSSGRSVRTGYKIVYVPFVKGQPTGAYEDFATGWMLGEDKAEVWGRPTSVSCQPDGSLLVAEDGHGTLWRIAYTK